MSLLQDGDHNSFNDRLRGISEPSLAEGTSDLIVTLYPERLHKLK